MSTKNILSESAMKIKTKLLIFSGISLFIGLTEELPTKLSLIGLNFEQNQKVFGWFLFIITLFFFLYFVIIASLNIIKYFKSSFINRKAKTLTGDILGLTYEKIGEEYDKQGVFADNDLELGTLSSEANDIHRQIKTLEERFEHKQITIYNVTEVLFNFIVPIIVTTVGLLYLYYFLVQ